VQSDGRSAQQVGLDGEYIAVAAGVMENRLDGSMLLNLDADALRAHAGRGVRRVGHIDGVDAELGEHPRSLDLLRAVDAARRNNLNQGYETASAIKAPTRERAPSGAGGVSLFNAGDAPELSTSACASMARIAERMARM